jgi:hypothetical protein
MARAVGGEIGDEERAAAEGPLEAGEKAAAGMRVHGDLIVHPGHRVGLAVDRLAAGEVDCDGLHDRSRDLVAHAPSECRADRAPRAFRGNQPRFRL